MRVVKSYAWYPVRRAARDPKQSLVAGDATVKCPIAVYMFGLDRRGRVETGYSMTSSAATRSADAIVMPSAAAV
jgi:hypothetical protein